MSNYGYRRQLADDIENLASQAKTALGDWLGFVSWDWYVTHTFAKDTGVMGADSCWQAWLNSLKLTARPSKIAYVRVTEYQKRGTPHFHSLIAGVDEIRRLTFKDLWELNGFARVEKYNHELGASHYIGKYLTKEYTDIRFSHNLKNLTGVKHL